MAMLNYFGRYMGIKGFETQQRARKVGGGWGGGGLGMNHNIWVI